ncbi:MAG: aminocarboxymuconate-semialdehyde decarboxylase [Betaproteobacteria bacterium RIFCSPLOWO2_12_FULL_68_19]|nr:MAG: aminocarboxymuconate-semialdehyde decarboxylase [Betaproteobacteria bacterium RIFCSPLOWO2_12_FULL_68_19]
MRDCIDIHNHIVPESFPPYAGKGVNVPWPSMAPAHACHRHVMISGKVYRTVSDGCWSVPRRIEGMGAMGVARQALSPMPELFSYWLPLEDAAVLVRYLNEQIAAMIALAPERFIGLGAVPLQDVDRATQELIFCLRELHFSGVEIASHVNGVSIGDARFEPFFAEAERLGAAIFVHALRPAGKERIVGPFPEQAVCFPGDIALACASMITGGIAARHPGLRIAFSHGGGGMAILLPRLVHAWNMFPKAKESLPESPEIAARRFYYDELVFEPRAIRFLLDTFGENQICLGTDYPFAMGDFAPMKTLEKAGLDREMLKRIAFKNARRFLGLPAASR